MKNPVYLLASLILLSLTINKAEAQPVKTPGDTEISVQKWTAGIFSKGKIPPFSFLYGGKESGTFIKGWTYAVTKEPSAGLAVQKTVYTYTDPAGGLSVSCHVTTYSDFPAAEWVLTFRNNSNANTPPISDARVIDHTFRYKTAGKFILHHSLGSDAKRTDFQPSDELLEEGKKIAMSPSGGRSSDNAAFPFFNIEAPGQTGTVVAVGWTGRWLAEVEQAGDRAVSLSSGMAKMNTILFPGEEFRTPSVSLLFWKGADRMTGHNMFRQFILSHHSRKINGKFAEYPLSGSFDYGDPAPCNEYNCLTADYAVALVHRYSQFRLVPEIFWLDAGWYTGCGWDKGDWWQNVGNWTPEKDRFPQGLRPIADAVHAAGAKFMVWFEPERVRKGTQFDKLDPAWLIRKPGDDNALFNLGNSEARIYLTDYISDLIRREGIDYYRQDFNFDPMPYWELNDKPGRTGMSEIRHIEGLYAYWDSLLVRFPGLLIDNCASGGRRLDIETISRNAPLWRTYYQYGEPDGYQCHTYGLNFYLPITGTAIYKSDPYTFRSGLGAAAVMNWEVTGRNSEPIPAMQKSMQNYKQLRPYYYGDYYPLTGTDDMTGSGTWLAYQMNRPAEGDGIVLAFRRKDAGQESLTVRLRGLDRDASYELTNEDDGKTNIISGADLTAGYTLAISDKPGSLLLRYKKRH